MLIFKFPLSIIMLKCILLLFSGICFADSWQMKQADMLHTGRVNFTVPDRSLGATFFDGILWQTPSPGSPNDGGIGSASMPFYDGAGPNGDDITIGGYHWPKGVQGMDRHTGKVFWYGNPAGGESIADFTSAFSADGLTTYVINDATSGPLMAFNTAIGPGSYWSNAADSSDPLHFTKGSVVVSSEGIIYAHNWDGKPYGAFDDGSDISEIWAASSSINTCFSEPSLYLDGGELMVYGCGRQYYIRKWSGMDGFEVESCMVSSGTDSTITIDPATGNIYVAAGFSDIYIVGLDKDLQPLWSSPDKIIFDYISEVNEPQRAQSAGCLSFDGSVYYFQTVSSEGTGALYAVNTTDGSLRWVCQTQSKGWEDHYSCPVVTNNGVVIVGNNKNSTYFAIKDNGQGDYTILDTLMVQDGKEASSSATISTDGIMYIPARLTWIVGNEDQSVPNYQIENLFSAFDLTGNTSVALYPPADQRVKAGNGFVELAWTPIPYQGSNFSHYNIYRDTNPFDNVSGLTPIVDISDSQIGSFVDSSVTNGQSYYYAVSTVNRSGVQHNEIEAAGPVTPRFETDLQIVSISRSPKLPRYCPTYSYQAVTEPGGFGPYTFSSATGFGCGQDDQTKHYPEIGQVMTYTATIRNRGTVSVAAGFDIFWVVDGQEVRRNVINTPLNPGNTVNDEYQYIWDNEFHDISVEIEVNDERLNNNSLTSNTLAVGFLTYIDQSFYDKFSEVWSLQYPGQQTDDLIDWLNMHMKRFNQMFEVAGCEKRVHYDVLEIIEDSSPDPDGETINWAIFPFRYHYTDSDPRTSGYYRADEDIDFGLLHEMGHQLGLIDIYQLDIPADWNEVNGQGYSATNGLMRNVASFLSEHSANGMTQWLKTAHGYYGQYLYGMPEYVQLRLLGKQGMPLEGAVVTVYQYCERSGIGKRVTNQIKAQGVTDDQGIFVLPNVSVDPSMVPDIATGDSLKDNPFGYVAVVGTNGVLLFKVEFDEGVDYCWLDITEVNNAYYSGVVATATFDRQLALGGPKVYHPPIDAAENNSNDWLGWAENASMSDVSVDTQNMVSGESAIHFSTNGGFDTSIRYPVAYTAKWDLSMATKMLISFYAENPSQHGFQSDSPWVRLIDGSGSYFEYYYYRSGNRYTLLNEARGNWIDCEINLAGTTTADGWKVTSSGSPSLSDIQFIEIHADTWDSGFDLWVDNISFDVPGYQYSDFSGDNIVDINDVNIISSYWLNGTAGVSHYANSSGADIDQSGVIDLLDFNSLSYNWLNGAY